MLCLEKQTIVISEKSSESGHLAFEDHYRESTARLTASSTEIEFIDFLEQHFDRKNYLKTYPDIKRAGADPLEYWLEYGVLEGRVFSRRMSVS